MVVGGPSEQLSLSLSKGAGVDWKGGLFMLDMESFLGILSLVISCIGLGYCLGSDNKKQK